MTQQCRLCNAISNKNKKKENTALYETDSYIVIPTIGQFVKGWVMIVSKEHIISARHLSNSKGIELELLINVISDLVSSIYGPVVVFEHGPSNDLHFHGGCCVNHTHIHIAPCNREGTFKSKIRFTEYPIQNILELKKIVNSNKSYLMYRFPATMESYAVSVINQPIPRQYLRRVLASSSNADQYWDWRQHSFKRNISESIRELQSILTLKPRLSPKKIYTSLRGAN